MTTNHTTNTFATFARTKQAEFRQLLKPFSKSEKEHEQLQKHFKKSRLFYIVPINYAYPFKLFTFILCFITALIAYYTKQAGITFILLLIWLLEFQRIQIAIQQILVSYYYEKINRYQITNPNWSHEDIIVIDSEQNMDIIYVAIQKANDCKWDANDYYDLFKALMTNSLVYKGFYFLLITCSHLF